MIKSYSKSRAQLFLSVGSAMTAGLIATGAQAATTTVTPEVTPPPVATSTVTAHDIINKVQENIGAVTGTISGSFAGDTETVSPTTASTITVDSNSKTASATGNNFSNSIDTSVIQNDNPSVDGAGSLGFSINFAPISSTASDNEIAALVQDFGTGSIAVTNNSIEANANGNSGSTVLSGSIPVNYISTAAGYSLVTANEGALTDWLNATGSLAASTVQIQTGQISNSSLASGNEILLDIANTLPDSTVSGSPVLDNNTIAATTNGNSSTSKINIAVTGGSPTFSGSAVVTNGQINADSTGTSSITATNGGSSVIATIAAANPDTPDTQLTGSLSVSGNAITSSASGNSALGATSGQAGNSIVLADGMSFQGSGTEGPGAAISYNSGAMTDTVNADLIINNSQGNTGDANSARLAITGQTSEVEIGAVVNNISGGSVGVTGNQIDSTGRGNAASSSFATGANSASFTGSVAVANQQTNYYTNVSGQTFGGIYADVSSGAQEQLPDSSVLVDGNTVAANAYGNSVSQNLALNAAVQNLPETGVSLSAGTGPDGNVTASGSATVTNIQTNYSSNVGAAGIYGIGASTNAAAVVGSSVGVTNNTGEAVALGNSGSNTLALSGATVGAGAGIASMQTVDGAGSAGAAAAVSASSSGEMYASAISSDNSQLTLSNNLQRGIAYGNSVSNTLGIDAQTMTVAPAGGDVASSVSYYQDGAYGLLLDNDTLPAVNAAYGLLNDQSLNGDVTATASGGDGASFAVNVSNGVGTSGIVNDANALVAAAYGTNSANAATLNVGNMTSTDFASVLNVTNVQTVTPPTPVDDVYSPGSNILASATGSQAVLTSIGNDVSSSSVSTSDNTVQALAYGNLASSHSTVTGTNIDTAAVGPFPIGTRGSVTASADSGQATQTDASFSVNNAQVAGGTIGATLVAGVDPGTSVGLLTTVGGSVIDSSVASNGNTLSSGATGNRADNLSDLSATGLAATNAVANLQIVSSATITSTIGVPGSPGSPGTPPTPFPYSYDLILSGTVVGTDYSGVTGQDRILKSSLTPDEITYLLANGWTNGWNSDNSYISRTAVETVSSNMTGAQFTSLNGTNYNGNAVIPGTNATPRTPNQGGVTVAVGEDVTNSHISISKNVVAGSVTGNSASNAVSASGTDVQDGSAHLATWGIISGRDATALGDQMLSNVQLVDVGSSLTSTVNNTFQIETSVGATISDSTLAIDGNSQSSRAVANTADNSVQLAATNTGAGASLVSYQDGRSNVSATSNADMITPVASTGSSVSVSDNSNLAVAVVNNVTNTLTVDTGNAVAVTGPNDAFAVVAAAAPFNVMALGDQVLVNQQLATDDVTLTATAATNIYNGESVTPNTTGIANGTVTVSGNSTMAEASANRAVNTADVSAGASMGASTVVANLQNSDATVNSSATTSAGVTLAGTTSPTPFAAVNGSSVTLGSNTTTALARGNAATNALNYSASADYGTTSVFGSTGSTIASGGATDASVGARAAVLNVQDNTGAVTATSTQASYLVALNSDNSAAPGTITNATVGVIGNSVAAAAYGNTASNTLTLTALNTSRPTAAVASYQTNSGPVYASVTTVTYGVTSGVGAVAGSALGVSSNSITATAVGNNAVTTIAGVR